jgi:putative endonuclease
MPSYSVYIMTGKTRVLYTGVTRDLVRRVSEHKLKLTPGFTRKYNLTHLAYYEDYVDVNVAIAREKQIKAWTRAKRVALIQSTNPGWRDLSEGWYPKSDPSKQLGASEGTADEAGEERSTKQFP